MVGNLCKYKDELHYIKRKTFDGFVLKPIINWQDNNLLHVAKHDVEQYQY